VKTFIGLQARAAPALLEARRLVAAGYVGRVLSATVVSAAHGMGDLTDLGHVYSLDRRNGNTALSVPGGHTLDALCFVLGEFREVSAVLATRHPKVRVVETGEIVDKTSPDNVVVAGTLESGASVAVHVIAGVSRGPSVRFEIRGDRGDLAVVSDGPHLIQMTELHLMGAQSPADAPMGSWRPFERLPIPPEHHLAPAGTPADARLPVAQLYATIAADLRDGTRKAPDFAAALKRHELLEAIERAAETGVRQSL
jgi:predicted dehydrogenase